MIVLFTQLLGQYVQKGSGLIGYQVAMDYGLIDSSMSYCVQNVSLGPACLIWSGRSHWVQHVSLGPTCHIGASMSHWVYHVSLGPTCLIGASLSLWV